MTVAPRMPQLRYIPDPSTIAEDGRYPLKTSPTGVWLWSFMNESSMQKQTTTPTTRATTKYSKYRRRFKEPLGLQKMRMIRTSKTVRAQPATNGICGISKLIAMAEPMTCKISQSGNSQSFIQRTSAMSVAMIAPSPRRYRTIFIQRGRWALQCCARLSPVTVPSRIARD